MLLQDLIAGEAARALSGATAILPLGSTEYHGPRGPYGTDCDAGYEIARRVAEELPAVLLPTLPFGHSPAHQDYPGTIHLRQETLHAVLMDIAESLHRHGAARLVMILGHWDDLEAARAVKRAWQGRLAVDLVRVFDQSILNLDGMDDVFGDPNWHGHGGAVEVSVSLHARPHVQPPAPEEVAARFPLSQREFSRAGWQGRPELATPTRGAQAAALTASAIVAYLKNAGQTT